KFTDVTQTVEITGVVGTVVLRSPIIKSLPEVATQAWTVPSVNNAILLQDLAFTTRLASVTTYSMTMVDRVGKTYDVNFKDKIVKPVTIEALTSRAELPTKTMLITITTSAGTITYLVPIITAVDEKALLDFLKKVSALNPTAIIRSRTYQEFPVDALPNVQKTRTEALTPVSNAEFSTISDVEQALKNTGIPAGDIEEIMNIFRNGAQLQTPKVIFNGVGTDWIKTSVILENKNGALALSIIRGLTMQGYPSITFDRTYTKTPDGKVEETNTLSTAEGAEAAATTTVTADAAAQIETDIIAYRNMCPWGQGI
ncbi:MAG: hypothetical protein V1647_05340, partial [Pseudomonadota bacterium]